MIDELAVRGLEYIRRNAGLLIFMAFIGMACYGFELFNLNLTIDEEIHGNASQADAWIAQGRWGMYLLNAYFIPQPVLPFVSLFVALLFHCFGILVLMDALAVPVSALRYLAAGVGMAFPGMAYMYTFSTINFGVGVGIFLVALSLLLYSNGVGWRRYLAAVPAMFALALYQGFSVALAAVYLVLLIAGEMKMGQGRTDAARLKEMAGVGALAFVGYYVVQKVFLWAFDVNIGYVDTYFDVKYLVDNFSHVFFRVFGFLIDVYSGSTSVYGSSVGGLGIVITLSIAAAGISLLVGDFGLFRKVTLLLALVVVVMLPFIAGFFMKGYIAMRFLVALPLLVVGVVAIGMHHRSNGVRLIMSASLIVSIFQSIVATNTLFSSSALALEADRLVAARLLERIEYAKAEAGVGASQVKYLEVVGYLNRPASRLMPKHETFGASFFEWDQGNVSRVLLFLRTVGGTSLDPLSLERRHLLMPDAVLLPTWPAVGSVKVFGDTIVLKFSDYSDVQLSALCGAAKREDVCK